MRTALDTRFWKALLDLPNIDRAVWAAPDERHWSVRELSVLLDSPPTGSSIYIWQFCRIPTPTTRINRRKRAFFHSRKLWAQIVYSRDIIFNEIPLWFDVGTLDAASADDISAYMSDSTFLSSAGMVIDDSKAIDDVSARILSTFLQAWTQQLAFERPYEWSSEAHQQVHQSLPGMVDVVLDSDCRQFLLVTASPATEWLLDSSSGELDLKSLIIRGVDVRAPNGSTWVTPSPRHWR